MRKAPSYQKTTEELAGSDSKKSGSEKQTKSIKQKGIIENDIPSTEIYDSKSSN